jgi:hypothetical protein
MEQHLLKAKERPVSIQTYARIAGVMFLMAIAGGGFGEAYAPSAIIVSGNAPLTAHRQPRRVRQAPRPYLAFLVVGQLLAQEQNLGS